MDSMHTEQEAKPLERHFLTTAEAAAFLGLSEGQLEKARLRKGARGGPPFIRYPGIRRIMYERDALIAWAKQGQRGNAD